MKAECGKLISTHAAVLDIARPIQAAIRQRRLPENHGQCHQPAGAGERVGRCPAGTVKAAPQQVLRPERSGEPPGKGRHDRLIHVGTGIASLIGVSGVHAAVKDRPLRHDDRVMLSHPGASLVQGDVKVSDDELNRVCFCPAPGGAGHCNLLGNEVARENVPERAVSDTPAERAGKHA